VAEISTDGEFYYLQQGDLAEISTDGEFYYLQQGDFKFQLRGGLH
jgi:hypothetical protein